MFKLIIVISCCWLIPIVVQFLAIMAEMLLLCSNNTHKYTSLSEYCLSNNCVQYSHPVQVQALGISLVIFKAGVQINTYVYTSCQIHLCDYWWFRGSM